MSLSYTIRYILYIALLLYTLKYINAIATQNMRGHGTRKKLTVIKIISYKKAGRQSDNECDIRYK